MQIFLEEFFLDYSQTAICLVWKLCPTFGRTRVFYISLFATVTEPTKRISLQFKARRQTEKHAPNRSCSGLNQTKFLSGYWWSISVSSSLFFHEKRSKTTFHTHSIITSLQAYFPNKESKSIAILLFFFYMFWKPKCKKQICIWNQNYCAVWW